MNITYPSITITELAELSGFTLPVGTEHREGRRGRVVPRQTVKQLRTLQRRGLFDGLKTPVRTKDGGFQMRWTPYRASGAANLYSWLDVACVRLFAWLVDEGVTRSAVIGMLRGQWGLRWSMAELERNGLFSAYEALVGFDTAALATSAEVQAQIAKDMLAGPPHWQRYPLAWLGMGKAGERMHKMREDKPTVWRWREVPVSLALREQRQAELRV